MTDVLLGVQLVLLVAIVYMLWHRDEKQLKMEQDLFLKALEAVANGYKRPVPQDSGVWEVLKRNGDGAWVLDGFVRENTQAWHRAYNTPGCALRHEPHGPVEEGVQ